MATIIQQRRDTAANWTAANPILAQGEFGFESDTNQLKNGDGVTTWNALPYWEGGAGLPPGTADQTLRHDGANWVANSSLVIDAAGNVGIGTTTPNARLATIGDNSVAPALSINRDTGLAQGYKMYAEAGGNFEYGYGSGKYKIWDSEAGSGYIFRDAGSEKMRIDTGGKVGIGTTTPDFSLDVQNAGFTQARFENTADTTCRITFNNTGQTNNNFIAIGAKSEDMYFQTNNGEHMRITSTGNVGIGTATPSAKLDVAVTSGNPEMRLSGPSSFSQLLHGDAAGNLVISADEGDAAANSRISFEVDNSEKMRIDASGSVLIGKTVAADSSVKLEVGVNSASRQTTSAVYFPHNSGTTLAPATEYSGNSTGFRAHISFTNANGVVGYISTTASATTFSTSSDYRLKENETPISDALTRVNQLLPYRFNFKADPDTKVDGFFAHEVTPVCPEAVTGKKDGEEMQGIDQSKLVPLLVAAIQELHAEVEALKNG